MNSNSEHMAQPKSEQANSNEILWWFLGIPILVTFDAVFDGCSLPSVILTLLSGLVLGSVFGLRHIQLIRHPLDHKQSHMKLTVLVSLTAWTVFTVVGFGLFGWKNNINDQAFWKKVVYLITIGRVWLAIFGVAIGYLIRKLDWYPLYCTRASMIRLTGLYLIALFLMIGFNLLLTDVPRWQRFLGYTGILVVWLSIARLWRN